MKLSNSPADYTEEDRNEIAEQVHVFMQLAKSAREIFMEEASKPSKPESNIIHLDLAILSEAAQLADVSMPLHELVAVYLDWADRFLDIVKKNRGRLLSNKALMKHLEQVEGVLATFGDMLNPKSRR